MKTSPNGEGIFWLEVTGETARARHREMSGTVAEKQTLHSGGLKREMTISVSKAAIMAFFILRFKTGGDVLPLAG